MRDQRLRDYYNRELTYLRQLGAEFADTYPDVASRLRWDRSQAEDPHVERLLQGVAFLAARVHLKVDDDFPEICQALLNVLYPQYLRPTPAMSVAQFQLAPEQGGLPEGWDVPRATKLVAPPTREGTRARFRTCFDTKLWPVTVRSAGWHSVHDLDVSAPSEAFAALRVDLDCLPDIAFDDIRLDRIRFYLDGELGVTGALYELLFANCLGIAIHNPDRPSARTVRLEPTCLQPVGLEADQTMLPVTRRAFHPYQLLQEYFAFPRKYMFVDLAGLEALRTGDLGGSARVVFFVSRFALQDRHARLREAVSRDTVRLGCTPIVNLFEAESRPIRLDQRRSEHQVVVQGAAEVFSIEEVFAVSPGSPKRLPFAPFYSLRHDPDATQGGAFWYARRQTRAWGSDPASDLYLSFADVNGAMVQPDFHTVTAGVLCTNGNLPHELPFGTMATDLSLEEESGPFEGIFVRATPTPSVPAPLGGQQLWRLVSMLSLNHLSLVDQGTDAFRELMRLQSLSGAAQAERHIRGIVNVASSPFHAPVYGEYGLTFARGRSVDILFDEELFTGANVYVFASVIERFLGLYASLNSFCRLVVRTRQREGILKAWPPRAGSRPLL